MNQLSDHKRTTIIRMLVEGIGIRSTMRCLSVHLPLRLQLQICNIGSLNCQ